jgi:hypothetical protein
MDKAKNNLEEPSLTISFATTTIKNLDKKSPIKTTTKIPMILITTIKITPISKISNTKPLKTITIPKHSGIITK